MNKQLSTTLLPLLAATLFIATSPAQAADGEAIVKKARCVACHTVDQKRVGPPYKDVAAKYKGDKERPGQTVREKFAPAAPATGAQSRCCPTPPTRSATTT